MLDLEAANQLHGKIINKIDFSFMHKKWINEISYVGLAILILIFLMTHTPNSVDYDAPSYINFDEIRPPLYPIFISLFQWTGKYQFTVIVWIHAIVTFSALMYARSWLKRNLHINDFLLFLVCLFVTVTILFHFQLMLIGAEGLTLPFFIWTFFLCLECFQRFDLKKIIYLSLWVSIIILTRLQFYYFYGVFIILVAWHTYRRVPEKLLGVAIAILSVSILFTCAVDRSYHYFKFGTFTSEPATGKLLIVQALFLTSNSHTLPNFINKKEERYVKKMLTEIEKQKLNKDANLLSAGSMHLSYYKYAYNEYDENLTAINNIVSRVLSSLTPIEFNKVTQNISKTLFLNQPIKNITFMLWKFIVFVGGVSNFLFFIILMLAPIPKLFQHKKSRVHYPSLFVTLVVLFTFFNAITIALFETGSVGYFCYTQFLLYCLAAYFADQVFFKQQTINIYEKKI